MRLYLVRHADPDYVNNTITERGHQEARALANRMAGLGLTGLYTSPLGRARDTIAYTADVTGLEPVTLTWTAELTLEPITDLTGEPTAAWNIAGEIVRGKGPEVASENWHELPEFAHFPYRERQDDLVTASDEFLLSLGYRRTGGVYQIEPDRLESEAVAVFCHAGFGVSWMAHLLAVPLPIAWCGFFWAPSSVTTILLERRSDKVAVPRALSVGDTSHLQVAKLPENHRGLPANAY